MSPQLSYYYDSPSSDWCGRAFYLQKPLYWYSDANQMARFNAWDHDSCNQSWYEQYNEHYTCGMGLDTDPIWGSGSEYYVLNDRCPYFSNNSDPLDACSFYARGSSFCHDTNDQCWFTIQTFCDGNECLTNPNCEPIFSYRLDYVGTGFIEGGDLKAAVYSRFTKEISYPLPIGMSFCITKSIARSKL